ncbi:MAG: hypothetical protein B7Z45_10840 [Azorhizobium sp. 12-66-6]|nr:MAG: hypothetical protein B7Z45_10840 [Azorhizobium sp. 12-66-6]
MPPSRNNDIIIKSKFGEEQCLPAHPVSRRNPQLRRATAIDDKISISTVYRTVKMFEDAGIIARHEFGDGRSRYEPVPDQHHDHLIDLHSGKVIEFRSEDIELLQEEIARRLGYRIVGHRLELYVVPLEPVSPGEEPSS